MTRRVRRIGAISMNLDFLARKREGLVAKANEILQRARTDERALTTDELTEHGDILTQVGQVDATLRQFDAAAAVQVAAENPALAARAIVPGARQPETPVEARVKGHKTDEYRTAFEKWVRTGDQSELRFLAVGTDTAGGHLVPDNWYGRIITKLDELNVMRSEAVGATKFKTSTGILHIPVENALGTAAWTAEGALYNESEDTYSEVLLDAHKATRRVKVSEELLADSEFDIESLIANSFARSFAILEEAAFVNGDGSGKPRGFLQDADLGKTATATNAITFDELSNLFSSVKTPYRNRGVFLMNDATIQALSLIKTGVSGDLSYLWRRSLQDGTPLTLFGRPVIATSSMPTMATGNKSVAFGDFSYFLIATRSSMPVLRLNEIYRDYGLIGFIGNLRVDSELTLSEAVKYLVQA
jgi:HK97 family phage major capsid protein